ncbi:LptE family protein [Melioribacteraceae bacterium 4301-Me]|uniref:LptE family protein n=1 Tax=Pyranulibacter aquaticus TaxID=3163344 RepID=UPI00359AAFE6
MKIRLKLNELKIGNLKICVFLLVVLNSLLNFTSCNYSFTGASIPAHIKTIAIPIFQDQSGSGESELSDMFTKQTIQQFIDDNSLQVTDRVNADAILEGTILSLTDAPSVVSSGENITTRRITLTVKVTYRDMVKKRTVFERNFSNYGDYPVGGDITTVRKEAIAQAVNRISEDILLAVVSNW